MSRPIIPGGSFNDFEIPPVETLDDYIVSVGDARYYTETEVDALLASAVGESVANIRNFGGLADGSTNTVACIALAIAAGIKTIVFDEGASFYAWPSTLSLPTGVSLVAGQGRPVLKPTMPATSRMLLLSGRQGCTIQGFKIDGSALAVRNDALIIINSSSSRCTVSHNEFIDCPAAGTGCLVLSGGANDCEVSFNRFQSGYDTTIGISNAFKNRILFNELYNNGDYDVHRGFGIRIGEGSHHNLVQGNEIYDNGLEAIGLYHDTYFNRILGNHAERCGDNGISVSGYYNTVSGNTCAENWGSGVGVWGSFNTITANTLVNNGQELSDPIWAAGQTITVGDKRISDEKLFEAVNSGTTAAPAPTHASGTVADGGGVQWAYSKFSPNSSGVLVLVGYGGTGQYNTISSNVCDDDQEGEKTQKFDVRIDGSGGYAAWGTGQVVSAGSSWRRNGLHIYNATTSGTTGATAPTHTSGTASDGGVSWKYVRSFIGGAAPRGNMVAFNVNGRNKSGRSYSAQDEWAVNTLISHQQMHMTASLANGGVSVKMGTAYADDAAAASAGVAVGQWYRRSDGVIAERVS